MLKPEQAKARLAQWQLPEGENRLATAAAKLPAALWKIAEPLYRADDDNDESQEVDGEQRRKQRRAALVAADQLTPAERKKLFAVVSPQLASAIEETWQLLKTVPYQASYAGGSPFRAPGRSEVLIENLGYWIIPFAETCGRYPADVLTPSWLAAWAPHLEQGFWYSRSAPGILLAASLNRSDDEADEIFEILRQSLTSQHEIGAPGQHVYTAFLLCNRPEAWELMEKTLLAAQRQEGLRQAILEAVDLTHPEAFRRMLRIILDEDLIRFASVVRAVDVWFGHLWSAASGGVVKKMLEQVVQFLADSAARQTALQGKDAPAAFLALWCAATEDALASIPLAQKLLASKSVELRYVAAQHLRHLGLDAASAALVPAIDDEDLRVALLAAPDGGQYSHEYQEIPGLKNDDRFERIERLLARLPDKPQKLKPLVWPWSELSVKRQQVASALLITRGKRPPTRLIPHLPLLDLYRRKLALEALVESKPWTAETRQAIVDLAGDSTEGVRAEALAALQEVKLQPPEVQQLEGYLTRKTGDLRRGVLALLLKRSDEEAVASAARLLVAKDAQQRLAGLELLRLLTDSRRAVAQCREQAAAYQAARKKLTKEEQSHLGEIAKDKAAAVTQDDALGLMNPAERTPVTPPRNLKATFVTPAAIECLQALDELVHKHREATVRYKTYGGMREELLGNLEYGFPGPNCAKPRDKQDQHLPLAEVWKTWFAERGKKLRDKDGLELVRARVWCEFCDEYEARYWKDWAKGRPDRQKAAEVLGGGQAVCHLKYSLLVRDLVEWLLFLAPVEARDYLLDATETAYALVPAADMTALGQPPKPAKGGKATGWMLDDDDGPDWRSSRAFTIWPEFLPRIAVLCGQELTREQQVRLWRLMHWHDQPCPGAPRNRVELDLLLEAYDAGAATLADVAEHLLGPRGRGTWSSEGFNLLSALTQRKLSKPHEAWLERHPEVRDLVQRAVARILELELARGDAATPATAPARAVDALWGIETLRRVLHSLGKAEYKVGSRWSSAGAEDRRQTLTGLAKATFPAPGETPEDFTRVMREAVAAGEFPAERLLQLTFLAPQWTKCVEHYQGWEQLSEGVYWFLAHMRYVWGLTDNAALAARGDDSGAGDAASDDAVDDDADLDAKLDAELDNGDGDEAAEAPPKPRKLSAWERLIVERTPLTDDERNEGAIDVAWFRRTHEQLGDERWQALAAAARFAANASQAKRAQLIADVLLGNTPRQTLIDAIKKKQLKEHVRLLGLLPLAAGKKRDADLTERCRVLQEYRRYANGLSGLTKPQAIRAWEIGMKNMAQTAGFADPLRLQWAVGADAVKDLAQGPVSVSKSGVTVTLALDELSKPLVTVAKNGQVLKSIPPAIKKDKKVAELTGRVADLKRQASAIRQSLETAMCRGDTFTGEELRSWCGHALLAPLLSRLVVIGEGILGYPDKGGKALRDWRGKLEPVKPNETLRLVHPHDLLSEGKWEDWQRECFQAERVQPFKQIFRELYVVTKQEKKDGAVSHRYDGQQVQPRQALALFGSRGWNTADGVFKVFHDAGLTANVDFRTGITTPAEVEGWTLAGVSFVRRDEWKPMPLAAVPPRLFSETMRDLDLVVSVAHAGGVDPEASASTVEMRAGLLRETCTLLGLKNIRLKPAHAVIDGELANYCVHLGSGTVHKMPGGSLCIVPVHAQQRGRLFLPFADDDPRTAEVISKVLLLARDREIQDPVILEQIRR